LIRGAERLRQAGATCIAVPCNTAHCFLPAVQKEVPSVPIFDMITMSARAVTKDLPLGAMVGLTATDGTIASRLYQTAIGALGFEVIFPLPREQAEVMDIIYGKRGVKAGFAGRANEKRLEAAVKALSLRGAQAIILGCTELSVVGKPLRAFAPIVDPMDVLAVAVTKHAKGYHDHQVSWVTYS